jgi:hypothetical protein
MPNALSLVAASHRLAHRGRPCRLGARCAMLKAARLDGGSFWSDFVEGFKKGARIVSSPLNVLSKIPGIGPAVFSPIKSVTDAIAGSGMRRRRRRPRAGALVSMQFDRRLGLGAGGRRSAVRRRRHPAAGGRSRVVRRRPVRRTARRTRRGGMMQSTEALTL